MNPEIESILKTAHSPIKNYIVPGLTSYLLSGDGRVRLFVNTREQFHHITPHSHRYDLTCVVLDGWVKNTIFEEQYGNVTGLDPYFTSILKYKGKPGEFESQTQGVQYFSNKKTVYQKGDVYSMEHHEVHSIVFSRDAAVLIIESETRSDMSFILEPFVDERIPTFKTEPWMFKK